MRPFPDTTARQPRRRSRHRLGGVALALLVGLLAACGGTQDDPRASGGTTSPSPSQSTTAPAARTTPTTSSPSPSATRTSPKATSSPTASLPGKLDRGCVRQGVEADVQGITITTAPGGPVGFVSVYSDGSSQVDSERGYKTGGGGGFADDNGRFRQTWIVPPQAPLGQATVKVNARGHTFDLKFVIVSATGTCP